MDEINNFFDITKKFEYKKLPQRASTQNRAKIAQQSQRLDPFKKDFKGTEYAADAVRNEEMLHSSGKSKPKVSYIEEMEDLDDVMSDETDDCIDDPKQVKKDEDIHAKFSFNSGFDQNLPIYSSKETILKAIRNNPVVVLEGDTGCGKTTQVPQYILAEAFRNEEFCRIVVTQPRRIAAISISKRVSAERNWPEGSLVGYQVGLHNQANEDTRLLYCTTGVLLNKLVKEKTLQNFTHIILDEVHERDQEMDFLLIVVRRLLTTICPHVKVILMSATINSKEFSQYFRIRNSPAPIIKVDSRRLFEVTEFYLDDLYRININDAKIDFLKPGISKEMLLLCVKLIMVIDNIEKYEKDKCAGHSKAVMQVNDPVAVSILVFLPGLNDIENLYKKLEECHQTNTNNVKLHLIKLHSLISPDEQIKVFRRSPPGYLKVILATNIAESSITLPDVKYVIDFCLTKVLVADSASNFSALELQWASRANCRQRAGRAGRVANGRVYRLITKSVFLNDLDEFGEPEMLRCPLENLVLRSKLLDMGPPPKILGLALNPPNLTDVENSILKLKEIGALYLEPSEANYNYFDGNITFIGRVMSALPLDVRLSRLVIFGYIFSVLNEAIIIAAGLSVRSIFKQYASRKNIEVAAHIHKLRWADNSGSDLFAILRAYNTWVQMRERHLNDEKQEQYWADHFFINLKAIKEMHLLIQEIRSRLISFGIKDPLPHDRINWTERESSIILKIVIAGAFYPNYFVRQSKEDVETQRNVYQVLNGHDPCNTVFFTNFNNKHIGPLYAQSIKELFKPIRDDTQNIEIHFPDGSERVYVTFKSGENDENLINSYDGSLRHEISKALYLPYVGIKTSIRVMDFRDEIRYLKDNNIGSFNDFKWKPPIKGIANVADILVPSVFDKTIRGFITHIESCSRFYFQPYDVVEQVRHIRTTIGELSSPKYSFKSPSNVSKDMIVAAPFENVYHRAKILKVFTSARDQIKFKVNFIDYGNSDVVSFEDLREIPKKMKSFLRVPGRCIECRLAMVKSSPYKSIKGEWLDDAMEMLQDVADEGLIEMEIYSVVFGVTNVLLKKGSKQLNDLLVESGFACKTDETYMSKADHDLRFRKQSIAFRFQERDYECQVEEYKRLIIPPEEVVIEPPPAELCTKNVHLKGPFSPLKTNIESAVRVGAWKRVAIERESVNCILLDTDPTDMHNRLVVAANVTESVDQEILTARATTLMPNIHGFGVLMTMLFCSRLELKTNKQGNKFSSILAGLGYDTSTSLPLHAEHDIVMNLDFQLQRSDVEMVNQLRYCMDGMLYTELGGEALSITSRNRLDIMKTLKTTLTKLLNTNRKYVEVTSNVDDTCWTPAYAREEYETPALFGNRSIFPMHSIPMLKKEDTNYLETLIENCKELHLIRRRECSVKEVRCKLCNLDLDNINDLRHHLLTQLHLDRESQINFSL